MISRRISKSEFPQFRSVYRFGQLQNALARSDWVENRLGWRLCDPIGSCKRSAAASLIYCVVHPCGSSRTIGVRINAAGERPCINSGNWTPARGAWAFSFAQRREPRAVPPRERGTRPRGRKARREPRSRLRRSSPSGSEGGSRAEPLHVPNEVWYNVTIPTHLRASRLGGLPK